MSSPIPYRPSTRPFALVRTRDQWLRASHEHTALAPGGIVELASRDDALAGPVEGAPAVAGGLAFDSGCRAYHAVPTEGRVERVLWAAQDPFAPGESPQAVGLIDTPPPAVLGDFTPSATAAGPLDTPLGLAVDAADRLFVCEAGANRVLVYDLPSRRLLRAIALAHPGDPGPRPLDLAAAGDLVYCVTASPAELIVLGASGAPRRLPLPAGATAPVRIASSPSGRIAILDRQAGKVFFPGGAPGPLDLSVKRHPQQPDSAHVSDLAFESEDALVVAYLPGEDFFRFNASTDPAADPLLRPLKARGYDGLGIARAPDGRIGFWTARGLRNAVPIRRRFDLGGTVVTFRLDSGEFQTAWGRIFLDLCVPDGTHVSVYCATADEQDESDQIARNLPDGESSPPPRADLSPPMPPAALAPELAFEEPFQPVHRRESGRELPWSQFLADDPFATYEAPVYAPAGRYLWVWLRLRGNGTLSPKVRCLRAEHPGHDYLRRLPRAFSREPRAADFLRRYLAMFEGFLGETEARGVERAILLAPHATPDELLPWLASFMGLALDERWPQARRRSLIAEIANLWRAKGTLCGLSRFIELYLGTKPVIVESFRLRGPGASVLGGACPPITSSVVGAGFRVGGSVFDAAQGPLDPSEVEDAFRTHAHRFSVIIPGALDDEQLSVVRDILEAQRPAHTVYDLCTMGAGMKLGKALHVGVTSIVGRGGGFEELLLGASVLGRGAIVGRPLPGQRAGVERLGKTTRIG